MHRNLRIAIDCRIANAQQGIGTAVLALAKTFSDSNITGQEYTFIVREDMLDWLAPYVYGPCRLHGVSAPKGPPASPISGLKSAVGRIKPLQRVWHKMHGRNERIPVSDGYVEAQGFDVVHFPTQTAYLTDIPSIYQPHDLQHLHYPQFFSKEVFAQREREYRAFCNRAAYVCVHAEWTRQDVIKQYGLPAEKVVVVPWGTVFDAYQPPTVEAVRATLVKFALPSQFFFYPAVTWPHKNHQVIIRALQVLKSKDGTCPHIYFTGRPTMDRPRLDKLAQEAGVFEQVHYLGFLTPGELQVVFSRATAMIFASKFEGFGLPLLEAFQARLPVVSSNAAVLPEIAQDGALYFDPESPSELAIIMKTVLDDERVRRSLIEKGTRVLSQYSFTKTAAGFQNLYRMLAASSGGGT
jgi:glycosyltransferase involved in cell wall biosynthesis